MEKLAVRALYVEEYKKSVSGTGKSSHFTGNTFTKIFLKEKGGLFRFIPYCLSVSKIKKGTDVVLES